MTDTPRLCTDWISTYLSFSSYNTEPPALYREWTAVSVIAAVLQRKVFLNWHSEIYPNMYICLVGPPGCRKGTAMGPGYKLLVDKGIRMAAEATTRESLIRFLKESGGMDVDPITGEAMLHASLTVFSQELTVFLGYNNQTLMSDLTDWFDCRERWVYRTKNSGEDDIIGVYVNLIGATTPELIHSALPLDAVGSGLTSRMIFVYEEKKGKKCAAPFMTDKDRAIRTRLSNDLGQLQLLRGEFKISPDFMDAWVEWYLGADETPPFEDVRFAGYFERRPLHLLKLSMIMSASRSNDMRLTPIDLQRAIDLLGRTEKKMPMTFMGHGRNPSADTLTKIMTYCGAKSEGVKLSELLRQFYRDVDKKGLDAILQSLVSMKIIDIRHDEKDSTIIYRTRGKR
jgi:hypothetical protein